MWIHAAHAEKGCIALSAPLVITNLAAFFLFSFTEFTCSTSGNSHDVRESSGLLTNNLKLWIEFKKQKKTKEKTTSKGYFIMWQRGCFFLRHGGHVEAVGVDVRYGPLWPETHRQPLRETRRKSYRRRCRRKWDVFQFTVSLFSPADLFERSGSPHQLVDHVDWDPHEGREADDVSHCDAPVGVLIVEQREGWRFQEGADYDILRTAGRR